MNLWTATPAPCVLTRALATMTEGEMEAMGKEVVENNSDDVERLRPYEEGWRRTRELCRPFWYGRLGAKVKP